MNYKMREEAAVVIQKNFRRMVEELKKDKQRWREHEEYIKKENGIANMNVVGPLPSNMDTVSDTCEETSNDRLIVRETPIIPEERVSLATTIIFQKNAASLSTKDDENWTIKKDVIINYLESSKDEDCKKHRKEFRKMIYNDPCYIKWSEAQGVSGDGLGHPSLGELIIKAGCNWVNWKDEEKKWKCESFHYVKQKYDALSKRQKPQK